MRLGQVSSRGAFFWLKQLRARDRSFAARSQEINPFGLMSFQSAPSDFSRTQLRRALRKFLPANAHRTLGRKALSKLVQLRTRADETVAPAELFALNIKQIH